MLFNILALISLIIMMLVLNWQLTLISFLFLVMMLLVSQYQLLMLLHFAQVQVIQLSFGSIYNSF